MFVSVGPSGFTVAGIVNMAAEAKRSFPEDFMGNGPLAADVLRVVVDFAALWLWGYVCSKRHLQGAQYTGTLC